MSQRPKPPGYELSDYTPCARRLARYRRNGQEIDARLPKRLILNCRSMAELATQRPPFHQCEFVFRRQRTQHASSREACIWPPAEGLKPEHSSQQAGRDRPT